MFISWAIKYYGDWAMTIFVVGRFIIAANPVGHKALHHPLVHTCVRVLKREIVEKREKEREMKSACVCVQCLCTREWRTERIMWRYLFFPIFFRSFSVDRAYNHYSHRHPIIWKMRKSNEKVLNNKSQEIVSKIFSIWIWIKFKWTMPLDRSMEFCLAFQTIYQCPKWCVLYIQTHSFNSSSSSINNDDDDNKKKRKKKQRRGYVCIMCVCVWAGLSACWCVCVSYAIHIKLVKCYKAGANWNSLRM